MFLCVKFVRNSNRKIGKKQKVVKLKNEKMRKELEKLEEQTWEYAAGLGYKTSREIGADELFRKAVWDE